MQIWIDSAEISLITDATKRGLLYGVTTNPSILAGVKNVGDHIAHILSLFPGPVAIQVTETSASDMIEEARSAVNYSHRIVVKVPATAEGLIAMRQLTRENIPVMATGVIDLRQIVFLSQLKIAYIAVYFSKLPGKIAELKAMLQMAKQGPTSPKLLVASIKSIEDLMEISSLGVDAVTIKEDLFHKLLEPIPLVTEITNGFLSEWKQGHAQDSLVDVL